MCSRFLSVVLASTLLTGISFAKPLTFCADPANLPFSSRQQTGFDNKIALLIGKDLGVPVRFYWGRMGRGFVRNVVSKGECDALLGVPVGMRGLLVTEPYYRSAYVFVTRRDKKAIRSLDDPRLQSMHIGIQVLEDDYAPPARALARRGLSKNVVGYEMDEDPGEIISAVVHGKVDTAIVWGPLAGYYAHIYKTRLRLIPVTPEADPPMLPFTFSVAIGVRKSDPELYRKIQKALKRAAPQVSAILRDYKVPLLPLQTQRATEIGALR